MASSAANTLAVVTKVQFATQEIMTRQHREIPALEALMQGMSNDQIAELQAITEAFEGNYDALLAHLKSLGAQKRDFEEVNGTAKAFMGKSRTDADLLNRIEMLTWALGYNYCTQIISHLKTLGSDTTQAFSDARRDAEDM